MYLLLLILQEESKAVKVPNILYNSAVREVNLFEAGTCLSQPMILPSSVGLTADNCMQQILQMPWSWSSDPSQP